MRGQVAFGAPPVIRVAGRQKPPGTGFWSAPPQGPLPNAHRHAYPDPEPTYLLFTFRRRRVPRAPLVQPATMRRTPPRRSGLNNRPAFVDTAYIPRMSKPSISRPVPAADPAHATPGRFPLPSRRAEAACRQPIARNILTAAGGTFIVGPRAD